MNENRKKLINVLIYGAGSAGKKLKISLDNSPVYKVRGFIDDDLKLQKLKIKGLEVFDKNEISNVKRNLNIKGIILAIPSLNNSSLNQISRICLASKLFVTKVPTIDELIKGEKKINQLDNLSVKDFLSREEIPDTNDYLDLDFSDETVLVTGGGGSIGSELCLQLIEKKAKNILILDHHEYSIFKIKSKLNSYENVYFYLGDINDIEFVTNILNKHKVSYVFHAAAYKHVHLLETNSKAAIKNNIFGTYNCLKASINAKVNKFILISTDKAVEPSNIMGATKRIAELILLSRSKSEIKTSIVRFGNVLGSKGSVIPLFLEQIIQGGPVRITDPKATRYFMTIKEAVRLVLIASKFTDNKIFILDMGLPKKIIDLAKEIIYINGLVPVLGDTKQPGEMNIIYTGLKKGEKLNEILSTSKEFKKTSHKKIKYVIEPILTKKEIDDFLTKIQVLIKSKDISKLEYELKDFIK